jgi:hypothetical protein
MNLAEALRANAPLLNEIFGSGGYRIDADEEDLVRVRAEWMELLLVYDFRDQFVSSSVRPLLVHEDMSEEHTADTLLRFLNIDVGVRRRSALDEKQVADELNLIRPLAQLLKDVCKSRDAVWFVNGYNAAYTDHYSGKW